MSTKAPNSVDKHVGSRVRMRRIMLGMSSGETRGSSGTDIPAGSEIRKRY